MPDKKTTERQQGKTQDSPATSASSLAEEKAKPPKEIVRKKCDDGTLSLLPTSDATPATSCKIEVSSVPFHVLVDNVPASTLSQPSTWIGLLAILISITTLVITWRKDRRAHHKSIDDDFWIRKVLFEFSLSPTLQFMANTADSLPREHSEDVGGFLQKFGVNHRELSGKLSIGIVLSESLYEETQRTFVAFEECISEYCAQLSVVETDMPVMSSARSETVMKVRSLSVKMLKCVKAYQQGLQ